MSNKQMDFWGRVGWIVILVFGASFFIGAIVKVVKLWQGE